MVQMLKRWIGQALMAAALAVVAGLAVWLAAPQSADAQTGGQRISAGGAHSCAVSDAGAVICWGYSGNGQTTVPSGSYRQVSAGGAATCVVSTAGAASCRGSAPGASGPPAGSYRQISAGAAHSCAVTTAGAVICWGYNSNGQASPPSGSYQQVSAGKFHSCALTTAGAVTCWGSNFQGQGDAPSGSYQQVSAGDWHTCALSTTGAISCWGSNGQGRATAPSGSYQQVSAGVFHTCAVSTSGAVSCWGSNNFGQATAPSGSYQQVSAGKFHSCGLTTAGEATCWGHNSSGQLNAPSLTTTAPLPPPTIGARNRDGYFPLSFGDATLGQLKAPGAALTVGVTPADSATGPVAHGAFAFRPGPAGGGPATVALGLEALAALRDEVDSYSDYDGAVHGGLAVPDLPVYVRYSQSASSTLRQAVLTVTLAGASGEPQTVSRTISVAPPAAPATGVAGMLRGDADQIADLDQIAELAIGLRLVPALSDGEAALTSTCLSASAAAPTGACPGQVVALGAGSRLQISGPATFSGTNGAKLLQGGLVLNCVRTPARLGGAGIACFVVHDHDGDAATPARAPSIRIDDDAHRDVSIDASLVAPSGASFYAQLMNADAAKLLYHDATGSYYPLASKYAGRHVVTVNCALVGENEVLISDGSAGPGETRTIERIRTQRCTTAAGEIKTFVERTRYAAASADG